VRSKVDAAGELTNEPIEPLAADLRSKKDGKANARLKLLAGMLGVGFDQLHQQERQRAARRRIRLAFAGLVLAVMLLAGYVALADLGIALPGGGAIRTVIDRYDTSLFRPVPGEVKIRRDAIETLEAPAKMLLNVRSKVKRFTV